MAAILPTSTILQIVGTDFTLVTSYSGEVNPNVKYTYTLTVLDIVTSAAIVGADVVINSVSYVTDSNGQVIVDLERGDYVASISKTGYTPDSDTFTILDVNVSNNVSLGSKGSFDDSFDNSFDDFKA